MRKKKMSWILICVFSLLAGGVRAQSFSPQAGDKSISLRLGRAISFGNLSFYEVNRSVHYLSNPIPSITEPSSVGFSTNNNMTNMIGAEFKYFITSQIAARISGAGAISSSPSQDAMEGVADPSGEYYPGTFLQGWNMFEGRTTKQFYADLGIDYYFVSKYSRVNPYGGIQFNSTYGQLEIFDGYRGLDSNGEVLPTYDTRLGEAYAFGGSIVGGVDYYLSEGFILGIEIKAFSYMYDVKRLFHQTGMDAQEAATHNTRILTQPLIKLGFRF